MQSEAAPGSPPDAGIDIRALANSREHCADVIAQLAAAEVASREPQVLAVLHRSTYALGQAGRASSRRANGLAATERSAPGLRANARGQQLSWIREDQMARPESFILDEV